MDVHLPGETLFRRCACGYEIAPTDPENVVTDVRIVL